MEKNYKDITLETYNQIAGDYVDRDEHICSQLRGGIEVSSLLDEFLNSLPEHPTILDVGFGGGKDMHYLARRGASVTGIDFSPEMVRIAKQNEPTGNYLLMDVEDLDLPKESFDGIWANASLHHFPKSHMHGVLQNLRRLLKPGGSIFIIIKQGEGEGVRTNEKYGKPIERYFAYYLPDEFRGYLEKAGFRVSFESSSEQGWWVNIMAKKQD